MEERAAAAGVVINLLLSKGGNGCASPVWAGLIRTGLAQAF
jgi:hypothetical protein